MPISASGIGTNLDIDGLVSGLMAAERKPLETIDAREASFQAQLSSYGMVKGALASLRDALAAVADPARYRGLKSSVSDSAVANASVAAGAPAGLHTIEVTELAKAHRLKTAAFESTNTVIGGGTLEIAFGAYANGAFTPNADRDTRSIQLPDGATLTEVRDTINAAGAGVTASLVNDGTGWRLALASTQTGTANALRIGVVDDDGTHGDAAGLSQLAYDASTGGLSQAVQTVGAADAVAIVDGIEVRKPSNVLTDVAEGLTITLAGVGTTTVSVVRDTGGATSAVEAFVRAYNDVARTLKDLSAYDAATRQGAILQGDATLLNVQSQLRAALAAPVGESGLRTLSEIGVAFDTTGMLKLDNTKLQAAIADPTKDIARLFSATGTSTNPSVRYVSSETNAEPGELGVVITQAATRATAVGGQAAALTITAGANDTLEFEVDGTTTSVTLAAGTYTAAGLAAELQSRLNGALAGADSGARVQVTQDNGVLTVASARFGSGSTIAMSGGTAVASLFGTTVETDGLDVAGSIGGVTATGNGKRLTAAGVTLEIDATVAGDLGTVSFARGYADRLMGLVDKLVASEGVIAGRTGGIDASIKSLDQRRTAMERRLEDVEKRYRAQFIALDMMLSSMQSTSDFLAQQLANLPGSAS